MKLWDFACFDCKVIVEYLQRDNADIPTCPICGKDMKKIFTSCNYARFRSGELPKPIVGPDGKELNLKKQDIFGRYIDDLPDSNIKAFQYWKKIEEFEETYRRKPPLEYKFEVMKKVGIDHKDKIKG